MISLDEPKHRATKDTGWSELITLLFGVAILIGVVTFYVVMPIVT